MTCQEGQSQSVAKIGWEQGLSGFRLFSCTLFLLCCGQLRGWSKRRLDPALAQLWEVLGPLTLSGASPHPFIHALFTLTLSLRPKNEGPLWPWLGVFRNVTWDLPTEVQTLDQNQTLKGNPSCFYLKKQPQMIFKTMTALGPLTPLCT